MSSNQQLLLGEGAGGGLPNFIEDVFSTYLYTGNGSTQTITNGIDLSTKGGLTWIKSRSAATDHQLFDTVRGATKELISNSTAAEATDADTLTAFNSNGFALGADSNTNTNAATYASWTFRKQPKFFDVVSYTGTGSNTTIIHDLGSVPGCIIVKRTDTTGDWQVYHRANTANPETDYLVLNSTAATADSDTRWNDTLPTSAVFSLGTQATVNASGGTYVAYLFAHDAGGFGLAGTDNVISCGTFTGNTTVTLGFEPQWVMIKSTNATGNWDIHDVMRGWPVSGDAARLRANLSDAESQTAQIFPNATGFSTSIGSDTYIYIAIRRGPMKVPTVGTSVFAPVTYSADGTYDRIINTTITPDMIIDSVRNTAGPDHQLFDRLRGWPFNSLWTNSTSAENVAGVPILATPNQMDSIQIAASGTNYLNFGSYTYIVHAFRRAPGFFDEVCYTGNGSTQTITHNLTVVPELIIAKNRGQAGNNWPVLFNFASTTMNYGFLNLTNSCPNDTYANVGVFSAAPTSTSMFLTNSGSMNGSGYGIVAYLFATCAGVSKVGSYTGNGSSQTIACGFAAGSRFVMIKRTDSTGDWYVWDSARGIVAGNDPHLSLNTTAAEVTTDDSVDTDNSGFIVNQDAATNVNVSSATYIFLAIA